MLIVNKIHQGDCMELLKQIDDNSIDCCITSPPYWGLRDYGTATWEGGDLYCDHKPDKTSPTSTLEGGKKTQGAAKFFKDTCGKCGATRKDDQIGLEETPAEYVAKMVAVFREVKRVLKPEGTLWLNLGDSYASDMKAGGRNDTAKMYGEMSQQLANHVNVKTKHNCKPKDLVGIPWLVAFALRADGWYLRQDIIWAKPNPMPESVTDRCTKSHEYIFLLSKSQQYWYDADAIAEPGSGTVYDRTRRKSGRLDGTRYLVDGKGQERAGNMFGIGSEYRNKRSVWTVTTKPFAEAHFATFPEDLIEPCVLAGCPENGIVLDPFMGAGTTAVVAVKNGRQYVGFELNPEYIKIAERRIGIVADNKHFDDSQLTFGDLLCN